MSLLRELFLLSRSVTLGLHKWPHGYHKVLPNIQISSDKFHIQQSAGFKNQTNRFKLPPVPKEKEKKLFKRKKDQGIASSSIPAQLISHTPSHDDVWSRRYFPTPEFPLLEVINKHREYAHPEMTDNLEGVVYVEIELDLTTSKKTKFLLAPAGLVLLPNNFDNFFPNRVIAITKGNDDQARAEKAGAIFIGGQDLVKKLEKGEIKAEDYDHVVMTDDMMLESSVIKKLLKDQFPSKKNGSLGTDIDYMVQLFRVGKEYEGTKYSDEEGNLIFPFGKLDMTDDQLVENIKTILHTVGNIKPNGRLFKGLKITVPPSKECFSVKDDTIMPLKEEAKASKNRKSRKIEDDALAMETSV